jgi:hypothetical protein
MSLKKAAFLVLALSIVIIMFAGVLFVLKHREIVSWPHIQARALGAVPVSMKGSDSYGIRMDIEYDFHGKKTKAIDPESFSGAFHTVAARADEINRTKTVAIIINPEKPDEIYFDKAFDIDTYVVSFIILCIGGFVLFVAFILLMGVYPRLLFYFFLVTGIVSLIVTVPVLVRSVKRQQWPTVSAKIEEIDMVSRLDNKGRSRYAPRARLYYEVAGEPYRGIYVGYYSGGTDMKARMERRLREWREKGKMDVRYNPVNPYEISTGPGFLFALIPLGIGLVFVGCAWLIRKLVFKA